MTKGPCQGVDATTETRTRMMHKLMADSTNDPMEVTQYFRHLVTCITDPPFEKVTQEIVSAGCLPKFVNFLHKDHLELQKEAAWVLGNISASIDDHIQAVIDAGAVVPLVELFNSDDFTVQNVVAQALMNIASLPCGRDKLLTHNVLKPLLLLLNKEELSVAASTLLRNLCIAPRLSLLRPCLPTLVRLVSHSNVQVSDEACCALAILIRSHKARLSPSLDSSFFTEFHNLHKMNPDRKTFTTLAYYLKQAAMIPSLPSQDVGNTGSTKGTQQTSPQRNSTPTSPQGNSTPTSPQGNSTPTSPQRNSTPTSPQGNSTAGAGFIALGKRRTRSPSLDGVSTRSTPKRAKTEFSTVVCISPTKPRTRAFSKRFVNISPNHSASYIFQKKDELFRAVEKGELERVEQLVHHIGPCVTRGRTGCTLLHVAAENDQSHVALFFLQLISPNVVNHDGHTPAHLAAMKGHTQVLRILLSDPHTNLDKRDLAGNIYTHWLVGHLFKAVLNEDVARVRSLLSVGADADQRVQGAMRGALVRELKITSARHLAQVLQHESILRMFDTDLRATRNSKAETYTPTHNFSFLGLQVGTLASFDESPAVVHGPDVYRMDVAPKGYVCILSYSSFQDRPDLLLEGSQTDAHNVANVFTKMGYSGHAHFSLTADQTRHQLAKVRDMELLERAGCAVFIISSHGEPRQHFLTSDMQTIDIQWVLDFFKDSQCPHLKNKPKLFIWDLCRSHQEVKSGQRKSPGELCGRVDEPLRDVMCLDSSSGGFTWYAFSEEGTPFIGTLCSTLARHAPTKELTELYREFLKEYARAAPDAVPQLTNYGFNKKFYFNPIKKVLC